MDAETLRNLLCFIAILSVMVGLPLAFNQTTKKEEFRPLLDSGQKINLNLFTLLAAYLRKDSDPLKPAHIKVAKIGFCYFFAMIAGVILGPTVIITMLLITGIR